MKIFIHFRDGDALKNGSYIVETTGRDRSTFDRVILGDFHGEIKTIPAVPDGYRCLPRKEAIALANKLRN